MNHVLIIHDVRSVINVGAITRTADAIGISKIFLTGYTPGPIDRFGRLRKDFAKASLGSEKTVKIEYTENILALIDKLKEKGYTIVSVEQSHKSLDYKKYAAKNSTAFIFGNEVEGIPQEIQDISHKILEIPMKGKKESLNVSVAAGIVLFRCIAN